MLALVNKNIIRPSPKKSCILTVYPVSNGKNSFKIIYFCFINFAICRGLSKKSLSCHPGLDPGSHPKPIINT